MWILLREVNMYDQAGKYFVAAWNEKPTIDDFNESFPRGTRKELLTFWIHMMNGGGRISDEPTWYSLIEYEEGTMYDPLECDGLNGGE